MNAHDIEEIKKLKARYFRCMDTKDWAGLLDVFTLDAMIDSTEAYTPTNFTGAPVTVEGVDPPAPNSAWRYDSSASFVAELSKILDKVVTVHHGHMPEIDLITPTTASGIWAMEDMLRWPVGSPVREMHGYGHYRETYERLPAGWRIKTLKLTRVRVDTQS